MRKLVYRLIIILYISGIASSNCYAQKDTANTVPWDTDSFNFTVFWDETRAKTYSLNNGFVFADFDFIDPANPDNTALTNHLKLLRGSEWAGGLNTQMSVRFPRYCGGDYVNHLYSRQDAELPIIIIPAQATEVRIRVIPDSDTDSIEMELLGLTIPDANRQWQPANKAQKSNYQYHYDGEWFQLTFPENHSQQFKEIGFSIITRNPQPAQWPYTSPARIARNWIFVQLPWTTDEMVLDYVPLTTLKEYLNSTSQRYIPNLHPHGFPNVSDLTIELQTGAPALIPEECKHLHTSSITPDSIANIQPFSQSEILSHEYSALNPCRLYNYMPYFATIIPDKNGLESAFNRLQSKLETATSTYQISELQFDNLPPTHSLYEWIYTQGTGIVYVSALGGSLRIRTILHPTSFKWIKKDHSFKVRDENWEFRAATEKEECEYSITQAGEWVCLNFPPNYSTDFRVASLSTRDTIEKSHTLRWESSIKTLSRRWVFIQLPWSRDSHLLKMLSKPFPQNVSWTGPSHVNAKGPDEWIGRPSLIPTLPPVPETVAPLAE